jgi:branched-chain amino acid transport system ATP-binding protein
LLPGFGGLGSQLSVYYVAVVVLALAIGAGTVLRHSTPGRRTIAVRDNERASLALGLNPAVVKLAMLGISGFVAGVGGVLWAYAWKLISPAEFAADVSLAVIAIPVIGGLGSLGGAAVAGVLLYASSFFVGPHLANLFGSFGHNVGFTLALGGLGLVATLLQMPNGFAGLAQQRWQEYLNRRARRLAPRPAAAVVTARDGVLAAQAGRVRVDGLVKAADRDAVAAEPGLALEVQGVHVRFGGVTALDEPNIVVRRGEIVGLIGANGAGKTTLMNVISGLLKPGGGSVKVFGQQVANLGPHLRAAHGVARSFQDATLFPGLTVTETIQVAIAERHKVSGLSRILAAANRSAERQTRRQAQDIVARFGLTAWADARTFELSTGTRRICDLAVQVAAKPKLLLLDEPTAGVAQREAEAFGPLLRQIRDELDCSVLIVEHDMPLLMGLCDRVYAMETGQVIAEGTPDEIRNNPRVIASYLGTEEVAISRSGTSGSSGGWPAGPASDLPALVLAAPPDRAALPGGDQRSGAHHSETGPALLSVSDLDFSYGQLQVLFGVSLNVQRGEALALLGTNGAGKSTLLRVIAGLEKPQSGCIMYDGRDIAGVPAEAMAGPGLVLIPSGRAIFTDMTVQENLQIQALGLRSNRALLRQRKQVALDIFPRLAERANQQAGRLSGGEQQQLALARALMLDPKLLCIDELSLGLAPVVVGELMEIVHRLNTSGITTIVVEQSLNIAAQLCPRAIFLEKGEVRFEGRTRDLLQRDDIARAVFFGETRTPSDVPPERIP